MFYQTFQPSAELAPYVRFFWVLEAKLDANEEFVHRSMADGCVELVFHYRASFDEIESNDSISKSPLSGIQAQSTKFRRFVTRESFGIFGAYLYPYAIPRLFSFPATDFTDIAPDFASVFGSEGARLEERMLSAPDTARRIAVISDFLTGKLRRTQRVLPVLHLAVNSVIDTGGDVRIAALADEHGVSLRQFERKFKELAGLPPKLYSRIVRFQTATHQKLSGVRDLTEIAHACGYYDQSHFINDFRQFSGYTPKEYFWTTAEGTQYMSA